MTDTSNGDITDDLSAHPHRPYVVGFVISDVKKRVRRRHVATGASNDAKGARSHLLGARGT
jgi:hypothetical protein